MLWDSLFTVPPDIRGTNNFRTGIWKKSSTKLLFIVALYDDGALLSRANAYLTFFVCALIMTGNGLSVSFPGCGIAGGGRGAAGALCGRSAGGLLAVDCVRREKVTLHPFKNAMK